MRGILEPDHLLVILLVIFLLFGAKKIPELAGGFGKGLREFKRGVHGANDDAAPLPAERAARGAVSAAADEPAREPRRLLA